jgi:hypothetical protein
VILELERDGEGWFDMKWLEDEIIAIGIVDRKNRTSPSQAMNISIPINPPPLNPLHVYIL